MQLQENKVLRHVCSKVDGSNSASDNVKSVDLLIACEQVLCLGKNSEEREGKGREGKGREGKGREGFSLSPLRSTKGLFTG